MSPVCALQDSLCGYRKSLSTLRSHCLPHVRTRGKKALQLLADADGDDMDLTALRLNMVEHILKLMKFGK